MKDKLGLVARAVLDNEEEEGFSEQLLFLSVALVIDINSISSSVMVSSARSIQSTGVQCLSQAVLKVANRGSSDV